MVGELKVEAVVEQVELEEEAVAGVGGGGWADGEGFYEAE